jgi:hypothetical protein
MTPDGVVSLRQADPAVLTPWFNVVLAELVRWTRANKPRLPPAIARAALGWG